MELTTDESGYAKKENIPIGNYDIRELKAPAGHVIQFKPQSIRIVKTKYVHISAQIRRSIIR